MVQQKAPDFDRWREHFDGLADQRRERGLTTLLVARDAGDAEAVVVLLEVADPERMRQHLLRRAVRCARGCWCDPRLDPADVAGAGRSAARYGLTGPRVLSLST